jgi:hypothetical protein
VNKRILGGAAAMGAAAIAAGGLYLSMPTAATTAGGGGGGGTTAGVAAVAGARDTQGTDGTQQDRQEGHFGHHRDKVGRFGRFGGLHGETTVRRKDGFVRVAFQRGTVTEVAAGAITVRSLDGTTQRWATTADTRVRRHGEKSEGGKVARGDFAFVFGLADGRKARFVMVPERVPPRATQAPSPN